MNANEKQVGGSHYKEKAVQPWNVVDTWPWPERVGFYRGNALKYVMRLEDKDSPRINAEKAIHYLEKLIEVLQSIEPVKEITRGGPRDPAATWFDRARAAEDLLKWLDRKGGLGLDVHERIREVLGKCDGNHGMPRCADPECWQQ